VATQVGVGMNLLLGNGSADGLWFDRMATYSRVLFALDLLFAYILVSALVHDDSLVGTNLFWRTRPISGGRLLGAKLLAAALMFGALPVAIWLPWWLTCHYGWREMAGAVPEILGVHAVAVMAALLVAVLTDNLGRFLGWTIMLAITLATLVVALASMSHVPSMTGEEGEHARAALTESRAVMAFAVLMAMIAIVVLQQFRARRPVWSFALVLTGFGMATLVCTRWSSDFSILCAPDYELPAFEQSPAFTDGITLTFDQARLWRDPDEKTGQDSYSYIAVGLLAQGVPEGFGIYGRWAEQIWRWPDGMNVYSHNASYPRNYILGTAGSPEKAFGIPVEKVDPDYLKWQEARRPSRMRPSLNSEIRISWGGADGLIANAGLNHLHSARMQAEPPSYAINAQFGLVRPEVQLELPLHPGDRHWLGKDSFRIVQTEQHERPTRSVPRETNVVDTMNVALIESRPTSWTDGLDRLSPFHGLRNPEETAYGIHRWVGFFLVNRDRGNMAKSYPDIDSDDWYWTTQFPSVRVGTVEIVRSTLRFDAPRDWRGDGKAEIQPHWFEHATLVKTTAREVARFRREVKVDRFETQP
jgi:hypothetical protein